MASLDRTPVTVWNEQWDEETWEEALLHHDIIANLIYEDLFAVNRTGTGQIPEWILQAAQRIVRYYMCRSCGYGLVDMGVTSGKCNDCAPRLTAEEADT